MGFAAESLISTREYGLMPVKQIYEQKLSCTTLCYDPISKSINFMPIKNIYCESRKSSYIIHTFKKNKLNISSDHLVFCRDLWLSPDQLKQGDEIRINHAKIMISDMIHDSTLYYKLIKTYNVEVENHLPIFVNSILIKGPE